MIDFSYQTLAQGSAQGGARAIGILYAEDFDMLPENEEEVPENGDSEPQPPAITQADLEAACAAATRTARTEWELGNEQMRVNALRSLEAAIAQLRDVTEAATLAAAEGTVTTILSIVAGLLPHFSRDHGPGEVRALLARLLPTFHSQTRINVRVHQDLIGTIQRDIAQLEPDLAASIDLTAAPLERGDVKVSWENGSMVRDSKRIMQAIEDALSQLGLQRPVEAPSKMRMAHAE